jgi:tRNA A-37 threonylcarbamoyl transferase component Bud32
MILSTLKQKSRDELLTLAQKYKVLPRRLKKAELAEAIYNAYWLKEAKKYPKKSNLGKPGKEGTVYQTTYRRKDYALKQFRPTKVIGNIYKEAELQQQAAKKGIAPKVIAINPVEKFIVMEKMDRSLMDVIKKYRGKIPQKYQKQIIHLIENLDKVRIFHGDPNPMNFMEKDGRFYIIDFGFAKPVDQKLITELASDFPNQKFMYIGLLIQFKEIFGGNFVDCKLIRNKINKEERERLGI